MSWLEALILGIVQGLTEYLPVSSSGHLEIGKALLNVEVDGGLTFDIVVHVATVLSTLVVLWKEVSWIFKGLFKAPLPSSALPQGSGWLNRLSSEQRYALNIIISMIPVGIVGVFFKDYIDSIFEGSIQIVGWCLLATALLLTLTYYIKPRPKTEISQLDAFIIGIAQAVAVLPGLSRSGSTIATGLLLGNKKETLAQFSFLMVIPPILGEALLDFKKIVESTTAGDGAETLSLTALVVGFVAAFVSGCFACKAMIAIVKRAKLIWFALYCALVGLAVILFL